MKNLNHKFVGKVGGMLLAGTALLFSASANASLLYGIDTNSDTLFTVDNSTGTTSSVGSLGIGWSLGGIAFEGSNLYAIDSSTASLYSINAGTGAATLVGATGAAHLESFAIINGVGYTQDVFTNELYSIDLGTGAATSIGSYTGTRVTGLTSVGNRLYGTRIFDMDLVELDTSTGGILSTIGTHGLSSDTSLAWADGMFWTIPAGTGSLYSLDPGTAAPTLAFSGLSLSHVTSLTGPASAVPEPSTLMLLGLGLIGLRLRRLS